MGRAGRGPERPRPGRALTPSPLPQDADGERRGGGAAGSRAAPGSPYRGGVRVGQADECVSQTPSPSWVRVEIPPALCTLPAAPLSGSGLGLPQVSPLWMGSLSVCVCVRGRGGSCSLLTLHHLQASPPYALTLSSPASPPPPHPPAACTRCPLQTCGFSLFMQTPLCMAGAPRPRRPPADPNLPLAPQGP